MGETERGRALGVDFGTKRIGLAVSDSAGSIALSVGMREVHSLEEALEAVREAAEEKEAVEVVVGIPYNMNGSLGDMGVKASDFAERLAERTGLPVRRWDERLTSMQAARALRQSGMSRRKRDARTDAAAAQILLQSYLDSRPPLQGKGEPRAND